MPAIRRTKSGGFSARVRIPKAVQDEYSRHHGPRHEAKFFAPAGTKETDAKRLYGEWIAEHEARVASILAERNGHGSPLTHRQAHLLAADWYRWFVSRNRDNPSARDWETMRDDVQDLLKEAASPREYERDEDWSDHAIAAALPRIADDAETQQFLAQQRLTLTPEAHRLFLRAVFDHFGAALRRLSSHARGDYTPDAYAASLPAIEKRDSGETPWQLFEAWVVAKAPAGSTIAWRVRMDGCSGFACTRPTKRLILASHES